MAANLEGQYKDTVVMDGDASSSVLSVSHEKLEVPNTDKFAVCMEVIAEEKNLRSAFEEVRRNRGAPGIDRQSVDDVACKLNQIIPALHHSLLNGTYVPGDIRRVWIPKNGGGERGLGIPNVIDRIVQQSLYRRLVSEYDGTFHRSSHGFRPGKSCHTAIEEAKSYLESGYEYVVDIDLEKFFDTVNHERLMSRLRQRIPDRRILRLIHLMLKTNTIMPDGVKVANDEGVPQGGPLSPLLSNIVLDELDWELSKRGHKFVRYADDCNIYVKSERAGKRVMESIGRFIEKKLRLRINHGKSAVAKPEERHFLGFTLRLNILTDKVEITLSQRTKTRIAAKIKELTPRNWGRSFEDCIKQLNHYLTGWMGYFRICTKWESGQLRTYESHIRRRLRAIKLKQWKRRRTIAKALITLGVTARTVWKRVYQGSKSLWALSHDYVVDRGLNNAYFADLGLKSLWNMWNHYHQTQTASM